MPLCSKARSKFLERVPYYFISNWMLAVMVSLNHISECKMIINLVCVS